MKVRPFPVPRLLIATLAQGRTILRGVWYLLCAYKWIWLALFAIDFGFGLLLMPHDPTLLAKIDFWENNQERIAHSIAWNLSTWGDYPTYNLPLVLLIWLYGVWRKSATWRRIAVVCFLGATLAGLFDDCFRLTMGRPRPDAHYQDGFYGIGRAFGSSFQSFPSGHAASVFGASVALLFVDLRLGIVTTIFAFTVAWARLELHRHYPGDVLVGAVIGLYFGLLVGLASQLRRPRSRPGG